MCGLSDHMYRSTVGLRYREAVHMCMAYLIICVVVLYVLGTEKQCICVWLI